MEEREGAQFGWVQAFEMGYFSAATHPLLSPLGFTTGPVWGNVCECLLRGPEFVWVNVKWRLKGQKEEQEPLVSVPYEHPPLPLQEEAQEARRREGRVPPQSEELMGELLCTPPSEELVER